MADYYVTTPGNGGNDSADGSIGTPWATLSHACSVVSGVGDIIHVAAGSYTDNTQAVLAVGVKISGASKATTTTTTTGNPYILATSNIPTVDGSNEISGIAFVGNNSNRCIQSHGRNNQLIHDNDFLNFAEGIYLEGKTPLYVDPADGSETETATHAQPNKLYSIEPATGDWATGCQIYSNTATNTKHEVNTIKGGLIHDNVTDNSGGARSAWGHTSFFWHSTEFYNNEYHISTNSQTNIGIEIWHIAGDCKFYNNIFDGWASLITNVYGDRDPYSIEVYDNDFSSDLTHTNLDVALECGYDGMQNVLIEGNYFANTGANLTYTRCIAIWGSGIQAGYHIRRNIFYTTNGAAIEINSTISTAGGQANPANVDDINIYNNVFDTGAANGVLITNDNVRGDMDGIIVRNNYTNVSQNIVTFSPNPPTGTMTGNFCDHNQKAAAQSGYVQAPGSDVFTVADNVSANGEFLATGSRWTNYYKPTPEGNLIDAGVDVGLAYTGTAPDIGAFEEPPVETGPTHRSAFRIF